MPLLVAGPASAHPLGNFTTNTATVLAVEPEAVRLDVVVDRAEIPTRQVFPTLDDRTGTLGQDVAPVALAECEQVRDGVDLRIGGAPAPVTLVASELAFLPGAAGLRTARLTCALRTTTPLPDLVGSRVDYRLDTHTDLSGWREVTALGDGVDLAASDVPSRSTSDALRAYPEDQLDAPLDVRSATLEVERGSGVVTGVGSLLGGGPAPELARGVDRWTQAFTDLVARDRITAPFLALAIATSLVLGAAHAFAPGHGKSLMAAYLLGRRGALRDAVVVGVSVTVTHTAGVLLLGLVLTAVGLSSPERVYPWLGLVSGLLLLGIGAALVHTARHRAATATVPARQHSGVLVVAGPSPAQGPGHLHEHEHEHSHHDDHDHVHDHPVAPEPHSHGLFSHTHAPATGVGGVRGLLAVGFAGGLVPSPSALVVLLGGIALGRAWLGVGLVVAYGVGMALALVGTGLVLVRARDRIDRLLRRPGAGRLTAVAAVLGRLPVLTAWLVVVVGVLLTGRALLQL
jgi:ABC-type nickel/cobalt efflux system permease component RcnA